MKYTLFFLNICFTYFNYNFEWPYKGVYDLYKLLTRDVIKTNQRFNMFKCYIMHRKMQYGGIETASLEALLLQSICLGSLVQDPALPIVPQNHSDLPRVSALLQSQVAKFSIIIFQQSTVKCLFHCLNHILLSLGRQHDALKRAKALESSIPEFEFHHII